MLEKITGPDVRLVDSAEATARGVEAILAERDLAASSARIGDHEYFVTDDPDLFADTAERFLGGAVEHLERVNLGS
jgi:glutamate racemase